MKYVEKPGHSPLLIAALIQADREYREQLHAWLHENYPEYSGPNDNISVTTLNAPPRMVQLVRRHADKIVIDPIEDNFYTLFGKVVHFFLEQNHREWERVEERKGAVIKIAGRKILIHGQADVYDERAYRLEDHKYTSTYSVSKDNEGYEAQLNVLAYIWERHGLPVEEIFNNYMFRDFVSNGREKFGEHYPTEKALYKPIPRWDNDRVKLYIAERVRLHVKAQDIPDDKLPHCTPEERWQELSFAAVRKSNRTKKWNKTADKVSGKKEEIEEFISKNKVDAKGQALTYRIDERLSSPKRCEKYCKAAPFCSQYQASKKQKH